MKRLSEHTKGIISLLLIAAVVVITVLESFAWPPQNAEADITPDPVVFTSSTTWLVPDGVSTVEVLVVAGGGGGGGGRWAYQGGGGGGGGGLAYNAAYTVVPGQTITVTVGTGGPGGVGENPGTTGLNSVFNNSITAYGGGGGGGNSKGRDGGSGGGGATYLGEYDAGVTLGGGNNGGKGHYSCCTGYAAGGGGGAGGTGGEGTNGQGGNGGAGAPYSISGSTVYYAAGGGGGDHSTGGTGGTGGGGNGANGNNNGNAATVANSGSGGGGAYTTASSKTGGAGADGVIIIKYTISQKSLTITAGGGGTLTTPSAGTHTYGKNEVVDIVAAASPCYHFVNWTGDITNVADVNSASTHIHMATDATIVANFAINTSTLTVNSNNSGGSTSGGGSGINCGTNSSVSATASACYTFVNWTATVGSGNVTIFNPTSTTTDVMVNGTATVTANFAPKPYTLTVTNTSGGTASGGGTYNCGTNASLSATNYSCYTFVNWTATAGSGNVTIFNPTSTTTNVMVNGTATVTANFIATTYTLNITSSSGGTVSVPGIGSSTRNCGEVVTINATADPGYIFGNWSGNTTTIGNVNASNTSITMSGNYSIQANFRLFTTLSLTASPTAGGVPTYNGSNASIYYSIDANPNSCWTFSNWSPTDGITDPNASSTTIDMSVNRSITAYYTQKTFYLSSITASPAAGGSPYADTYSALCGNSIGIHASTNSSYYDFVGWTPASSVYDNSSANTLITMTQNRSLIANFALKSGATPTPTPTPTPAGPITYVNMTMTRHMNGSNFSIEKAAGYVKVNMTSNITSRGQYMQKTLTIYIAQRPSILAEFGRGGIWGDDTIFGLDSLNLLGELNLFNGDLYINGTVTVGANKNKVTKTIYADNIVNPGYSFTYGSWKTCPLLTMPNVGVPADYFTSNLSDGKEHLGTDNPHEFVFTGDVSLTARSEVWLDSTTLKPGYYYSPGTITLTDHSTRGTVTFIANKIVLDNDIGSTWDMNAYIGIKFYDPKGLLLWATGNSSHEDIWIKGSTGTWNPCVMIEGILFAPNGEIELAGSGSSVTEFAKAMITRGAIIAKDLTVSGHDWWIYRW